MHFLRFPKHFAVAALSFAALYGQQSGGRTAAPKPDKAEAYYNYAMGHLYAELATAYGNRGEYLNNAIEYFRSALKADPKATFITEELAELYVAAGQIRTAVTEAEEAVKSNPEDLTARRILGRIFTRLLGDGQQGRINETMLKKAIEQYERITEKDTRDVESLLMLGRLHKVAQSSPEAMAAYKRVLTLDPENEDAQVGLAMVYADLGDNKGASELLEKAVSKSPNLRTLTTLASSYEQMREFKLAAETLRRAMDLSPGNPDLRRAYAQNLLFSDQDAEALKQFQDLVTEDPRDTQSWLRISQIFRQQRKFTEAREAAQKARDLDPNNLEIRYNEVALLEAEGSLPAAIEVMQEILSSASRRAGLAERSNRGMLLERLGLLYRQNDQVALAVETFRQMIENDADSAARASAQIVETYRGARDYPKAIAEADTARAKYPEDRTVKLVRANLLAEVGRAEEGAKDLRTLLDGKGDRDIYLSLAQVYEKAKDYRQMAAAIDEAEKLSSSEAEKENLAFLRGAMFEKMKNFEAAEAEFRKVLALDPGNASALNYLGYMLADRNIRLQEAYGMIRKAVDLEPNNGAFLDSLGWVLYRLDKLDEAERYLLQAIERAPRDPTVHDHLGDLYAKQGRTKDALTQWEVSLREWNASSPAERDSNEVARVQKKIDSAKVKLARENSPKP